MKQLIALCGVFLATALMIPSVITLTYKKTADALPADVEETFEPEPVWETDAERSVPETCTWSDWMEPDEETEPAEETQRVVRVYRATPTEDTIVDRYSLYSPDVDSEWFEEEERVLGPLTEETEPEPETEPETTAPETTRAPVTTAAETTKAPETDPEEETKTPDKDKAPEETASAESGALKNTTGKYVGCDAKTIRVYVKSSGKYVDMLMGDYLIGVVAAEMPVRFDIEALKAQAVASRTFALYKSQSSSYYHSSSHGPSGADVCTNSGHCQAYLPYETALVSWSDREYVKAVYDKIRQAVTETSGVVITYEGKPIEAVFHATSYGSTDSMTNVWGGEAPYLKGVSTPEKADTTNVYSTEVFTSAEVKSRVLSKDSSAKFSSDPSEWMQITKSDTGRVKNLRVGTANLNGQACRSAFALASNNFTVSYDKDTDKFTFEVYGWGHGVGMSQYGAGIYAEEGKDYEFIVKHYYSGTELVVWG